MCTAIFFKIAILILALFTKRSLIHIFGNDAKGLNSRFLSIIGFLLVAKLGIGTAISFSMYGPIVRCENLFHNADINRARLRIQCKNFFNQCI